MWIRGVVQVDDVRLMIDIDVPDGEREVYVTNVSHRCLVIPQERWPLDLLDLDDATLRALTGAGLKTVGDVVDCASPQWAVRLSGELEPLTSVVQGALDRLRAMALIFGNTENDGDNEPREPFPIAGQPRHRLPPVVEVSSEASSDASGEKPEQKIPLEANLTTIGVPGKVAKKLAESGAATIGQLLERGRRKLVMTQGVKATDVELIEQKLRANGFVWPTPATASV